MSDEETELRNVQPVEDLPSSDGPDEQQVRDLREVLVEQNKHLISQLSLLGQQPSPFLQLQCEMAALVDFVFDDGAAREQYETAVEFRFNAALKAGMAKILGNVPGEG